MTKGNYLAKEDELLTEIALIDTYENAMAYKDEFHSSKHVYPFEYYIDILKRIKYLLLKGCNDKKQIVFIIRYNLDDAVKEIRGHGKAMGIEQMLYYDMAIRNEKVLVGNVDALERLGIYVTSNNRLKRHGLPMRRKKR